MKKLILGAILLFSTVIFTACSEGEDSSESSNSSNSSGTTVQCSATTQEGARCLRMTTNSNGKMLATSIRVRKKI